MTWPLSQDYNEAIQTPAACFQDPDLQAAEAATDPLGIPRPHSGNFADVYELRGPGHQRWAVKCFTRQIPGLRERYLAISKYLQQVRLPFMVEFQFLDQGIRVGADWYPLLKMDWVEGFTFNEFVQNQLDRPQLLEVLCQIWVKLAKRLRQAQLAHCDLQHGNVLLVPGSKASSLGVKLVDYDGMCLPALTLLKSIEVGHPNFQHPQRARERLYNLEIDRFSHLAIYTALRALIAGGRSLWQRYDNGDNLLFKQADFAAPAQSAVFAELLASSDGCVRRLTETLMAACAQPLAAVPLLEELPPPLLASGGSGKGARQSAEELFATATATTEKPVRPAKKKAKMRTPYLVAAVLLAAIMGGGAWFACRTDSNTSDAPMIAEPPPQETRSAGKTAPKQASTAKKHFPFRLKPLGNLDLMPGESRLLEVAVERQTYLGPISLELADLPAGLQNDFVTIRPGESSAKIKIAALPEAGRLLNSTVKIVATVPGGTLTTEGLFLVSVREKKLHAWIPLGQEGGHRWRFWTAAPPAGWEKPDYDDGQWSTGPGAFGPKADPRFGLTIGTNWTTRDVCLRTRVVLPSALSEAAWLLKFFHDEDLAVYVNGRLLLRRDGWVTAQVTHFLSPEEKALFHPGENLLAVHCRQHFGWQGLDLGLYATEPLPGGQVNIASGKTPAAEPDVYLADLQEVEAKTGWGAFLKNGQDGDGRKITVNGRHSPHGLFLHPPNDGYSYVKYCLAKKYHTFTGSAAVNDAAVAATPLTFVILGEGKTLWESQPLRQARQTQEFSVAVAGMEQLELRVYCPGRNSSAHAVWLEPRLLARPAERQPEDEKMKKLAELLQQNPDDPQANLLVGQHLCLQGDWEAGLPRLVKGSDRALQALAGMDLAQPAAARAQAKLADAYWDYAQEQTGTARAAFQLRAAHWYHKALPQLAGLKKTRSEKRLEEAGFKPPPATEPVKKEEPLFALKKWVNVLPFVDLDKHVIYGDWTRSDSSELSVLPGETTRVAIPVVATGNYDLAVEFTRLEGNDCVCVMLPVDKRSCMLVLSGWEGRASGLHLINGRGGDNNPSTIRPGTLINKQRYLCEISLRHGQGIVNVSVWLNRKRYLAWQGPLASLAHAWGWSMPYGGTLGLGCTRGKVTFHKVAFHKVSGKADLFAPQDLEGYAQDGSALPQAAIRPQAVKWRDNWYWFNNNRMTFPDAQALARSMNGRLLLISSQEENDFVTSKLKGVTFLGLVRKGGTQQYLTDRFEVQKFHRWDNFEPTFGIHEKHVAIHDNARWHNWPDGERHFVCVEWGPEK